MRKEETIQCVIDSLEQFAPRAWQESYDNSGLQVGDPSKLCTGVLIALDVTEEIVEEAKAKRANLILSHHPLLFKGLKSISGKNYVERIVIEAIKNDITIYSIHTNLDKMSSGVSGRMADRLGLLNREVLVPDSRRLMKLVVFVPTESREGLLKALNHAGAGQIGAYDSCAYWVHGQGQFRPLQGACPTVGMVNEIERVNEDRVEVIFPDHLLHKILAVVRNNHPYEEPAYDLIRLENDLSSVGLGIVGDLPQAMPAQECLNWVRESLGAVVLRHSPIHKDRIRRIALAGGSCGECYVNAISLKADLFVTGEVKYHDFFNHENRIIIADLGHFESEQYTNELIMEIVRKKNITFAVYMSEVKTNPIRYIL